MLLFRTWCFRLALPLFLALPCLHFAVAQTTRTASRGEDVAVFGGVEFADPAYGPDRNTGGALGVDFTQYLRIPIQPSLEFRANFNGGTFSSEQSYLIGLRGAYAWRQFLPYVDFLVGPGNIHYPLNLYYTHDNSIVYNFGVGVDVDVTRNFSLKLDIQEQRWNTGTLKFQPTVGIVGITYHIPFRSRVGGRY